MTDILLLEKVALLLKPELISNMKDYLFLVRMYGDVLNEQQQEILLAKNRRVQDLLSLLLSTDLVLLFDSGDQKLATKMVLLQKGIARTYTHSLSLPGEITNVYQIKKLSTDIQLFLIGLKELLQEIEDHPKYAIALLSYRKQGLIPWDVSYL